MALFEKVLPQSFFIYFLCLVRIEEGVIVATRVNIVMGLVRPNGSLR